MEAVKASELRIGNLVTLNAKQRQELFHNQIHAQKEFYQVKTIYSDGDIALELDDEIVDLSETEIQPIELTEQYLLDFGFTENLEHEHPSFDEMNLGDFYIGNYNDKYWIMEDLDQGSTGSPEIKYVHQLQNLYFAITGTELTLIQKSKAD